jgi:hypothetical protein
VNRSRFSQLEELNDSEFVGHGKELSVILEDPWRSAISAAHTEPCASRDECQLAKETIAAVRESSHWTLLEKAELAID